MTTNKSLSITRTV